MLVTHFLDTYRIEGADSYTLLHVLEALRKKAPVKFELIAVNIDPGFPGYNTTEISSYLQQQAFNVHIETTNSYEIIEDNLRPGTSYCSFCARLRRGFLYAQADRLDCNKIALGHHLDDFIETLFLNQFFSGKLAAMSPKLKADNDIHTVIRPMVYVEENDIMQLSQLMKFPIIHCCCPVVGETDHNRQKMKQLISQLAEDIPDVRSSLLNSLKNVYPHKLLDQHLSRSHSDN